MNFIRSALAGLLLSALAASPVLSQAPDSAPIKLTLNGFSVPAGTAFVATCTAPAYVTLALADGTSVGLQLGLGTQRLALAVTGVAAASAACNFYNVTAGASGTGGTSSTKSSTLYTATASGTGYATGDLLDHVVTSNPASTPNAGAVTANYWIDLTSGALLSAAPTTGNITLVPTTITNADFGADCLVVSGDQAYTVGATQRCTTTVAGAIRVATPIPTTDGAIQLALIANSRAQLGTQITAVNGVVCKASPTNTADVLIGGSAVTVAEDGTGSGWPLAPGESWASAISSTGSLYFISSAAAVLFCHGN